MSETSVHPNVRAEDILAEIQANLLECKVCFEKFSIQKQDHTPRYLPCGHVLCLKCICALSHPVSQRLECPFCRKLCDVGSTSECRVLANLQELLLIPEGCPGLYDRVTEWTKSLGSGTLRLRLAFGGWGTIVNPSGMVVSETSGQIVLAHDGEKRVAVFGAKGTYLDGFGRYGHGLSDLCYPLDVALTKCGHVLVTDAGDQSVKVFTFKGHPVTAIRDSFCLPWGVDVDANGHVFVTDAEMGTLNQVIIDFSCGAVVVNRVVFKELTCPRSVASCKASGNIAVVEHFQGRFKTCLRIFNSDFVPLAQVDSFVLYLKNSLSLSISSVVFDRNGGVIVGDARNGMVWSLGKPQKTPTLTPLLSGLLRPVALATTTLNVLVLLDGGDHAVKCYAADTDDLYCDKK
ncbi:E3 ubiquitin-protein ligase NHLRC1-like [Pseudorasbora parva]|uniref:E3 ubiquitin-protein ligase NHLRC1-like n=1 Tax=Pseudorasbora parva TaxID=51549 RepID=UPI00351EBB8A